MYMVIIQRTSCHLKIHGDPTQSEVLTEIGGRRCTELHSIQPVEQNLEERKLILAFLHICSYTVFIHAAVNWSILIAVNMQLVVYLTR